MSDLSSNRPPGGSLHPFGPGRSFHPLSRPLQPGIRFLRLPVPASVSTALAGCLVGSCPTPDREERPPTHRRGCHVPHKQQNREGSAFTPEASCQRVPTKQQYIQPRPILGRAYAVVPTCFRRFGPSSLTTFRWQFACANPSIQPSTSSGFVFRNHARPLAGASVPPRVVTLSERSVPDRYQSRTAPWLPAAEHRVGQKSCRPSSDNCLRGLRRVDTLAARKPWGVPVVVNNGAGLAPRTVASPLVMTGTTVCAYP